MSKIDEQYFGEDAKDYPWPEWSNSLGEPPRIRFDDMPDSGSQYLLQLKAVLMNIAVAARQEEADALREQLKSLSDKTILIHPAEKDEPNMIVAAQDIAFRGSRTLSPPHIQYNPQRWERYQVEGASDAALGTTAIASPEQLLLDAMAGYRNLYEAYVDHMQAGSPATPVEERNRLYTDALRLDELGYNHEAIAGVVNASMKSAVPGFQERSPRLYDQSEPLSLNSQGIPVVKPEEEEALKTALKIRQYSIDRQVDPKVNSTMEHGTGNALQEALAGISHADQQVILTQMLKHVEAVHPEMEKQAIER